MPRLMLAIFRNGRRLLENVDDGETILHLQRHEHARHERKMETHLRFVAVSEIGNGVFRPLVGFRQQHAAGEFKIDMGTQLFQVGVGLGKIFAISTFALIKIRDGVEPQSIHPEAEPKVANFLDCFVDQRVVEVEIGLMRIEAMPVIRFHDRVPGPV